MLALTLNPGFVELLAVALVLLAPRGFRAPTIAGAALVSLWLLLDHEFGAAAAMAQMGLPVVLLDLDALNRIFGVALLMALIATAAYSGARDNRFEDAAILLLAGGAVSALFVGDLVSFVACVALAGLAASAVVFASSQENANRAGVRLLIWHGLEGLLLLVGVAFHLSGGAQSSVLARLDVTSIGGAFIFAALMIRVGAPLAHVWLKDAIGHASPTGAVAMAAFSSMLGVYALARFFPAEPLLTPIGVALIVIGAFYLSAEDDLRRAGAYGQMTQIGVSLCLIGVGSPLALAGAEGQAFATILSFLALQMALGALMHRFGHANISRMIGAGVRMPVTSAAIFISGLCVSGAPGFAMYATHAIALDATATWETRGVWALIAGASAVLFVSLVVRPTLALYREGPPQRVLEAPFAMLQGMALALFYCIAIGVAPGWLYNLMPAELSFKPYALDRLSQHVEVLAIAGCAYLLVGAARSAPTRPGLLDLDSFYSGPVASAGRWFGLMMLRAYGASGVAISNLARAAGAGLERLARSFDRPYSPQAGNVGTWLVIAAGLIIVIAAQRN